MKSKINKRTGVWIVFAGTPYESNDIIGVYQDEESAKKRCAKTEKEQEAYQAALSDDKSDAWIRRKWSDTASQHYAYVKYHKVISQ